LTNRWNVIQRDNIGLYGIALHVGFELFNE
jgi:hypothetical protein